MNLTQILKNIDCVPLNGKNARIEIADLCDHTKKVSKGCLFFCVSGARFDSHAQTAEIINGGAAALVVEKPVDAENLSVPCFLTPNARAALASCARRFFGIDAFNAKADFFGVTGTNGKTSATYFIASILRQTGRKTAVLGTLGAKIDDAELPVNFDASTTPDALQLARILRAFSDEGANAVVMEVSSHALCQERVSGLFFKAGVFTNLTRDHLDYHETMENYFLAKSRLFDACEHGAFNTDDEYGLKLFKAAPCKPLSYGIKNDASVCARNIAYTPAGVSFDIVFKSVSSRVNVPIPGTFTVYNALAAAAACLAAGLALETVIKGLQSVRPIAGRIQSIPNGRKIAVIVDYAHTPDGLGEIIKSVRPFSKRVITVFGAGGDRDKTKRPIMGRIAGELSDFAVLTSDNPRGEDPYEIIAQIEEGIKKTPCEYTVSEDRKSAIEYAIDLAREGDSVIIAGKGHEQYQERGGQTQFFSDAQTAADYLNKTGQNA